MDARCAPDLWSLITPLKLTWFRLGAHTSIWSGLKSRASLSLASICVETWAAFLRGEGGDASPRIFNLITHLLKWCSPAAQITRTPTQNWGLYCRAFEKENKPPSRFYGQHTPPRGVSLICVLQLKRLPLTLNLHQMCLRCSGRADRIPF